MFESFSSIFRKGMSNDFFCNIIYCRVAELTHTSKYKYDLICGLIICICAWNYLGPVSNYAIISIQGTVCVSVLLMRHLRFKM